MRTTRRMLLVAGTGALLLGGCAQEGDVAGVPSTTSTTRETAPAEESEDGTGISDGETSDEDSTDDDSTDDDSTEAGSSASADDDSDDDSTDDSDDAGTAAAPPPSSGAQASGSGCEPGDEDDLPDGRWYGQVTGIDDDSLQLDLMCWFEGEDAVQASVEDGKGEVVPNDYYIRDEQDIRREVDYAADAPATHYDPMGGPETAQEIPMTEWAALADEVERGVWLTVEDGEVVELEEQWVP